MNGYSFKQITDPVHTTIGISELEAEILNPSAFQRLRSIRQLGLAHLVFPGADYSRFSHSLGVCHVTGLILNALREYSGADFDAIARQLERFGDQFRDPPRQVERRGPLLLALGLDDRKLVAAEPRQRVGVA